MSAISNRTPFTPEFNSVDTYHSVAAPKPPSGEKDLHHVPMRNVKRPPGDHRSAEQIIDDNPILKSMDSQKGLHRDLAFWVDDKAFVRKPKTESNIFVEMAYEKLGDWTANNPDPESRADAAYNAARVLNWIDSCHMANGQSWGSDVNNGKLEGFTQSGFAIDGTPAAQWQAFLDEGYGALPSNRRLDERDDNALEAGPYPEWSDRSLIGQVKNYFREFAAGKNDRYVNFNELKEAAGLIPTRRKFSPEAQEVALEILARPALLRKLDIGVGLFGLPGSKDNRFDMDNIDHLYERSSDVSPLADATLV